MNIPNNVKSLKNILNYDFNLFGINYKLAYIPES